MKIVAVLTEDEAFAPNARGSARGGGVLGAAGIDWCITILLLTLH